MRDLLFKNLTSSDRKKRIISSSEITDKSGIRSVIRRHFICMIKELKCKNTHKTLPYLYILKERNSNQQEEKFFCRIKNSVLIVHGSKLYEVFFMHSLKINLSSAPADLVKHEEE